MLATDDLNRADGGVGGNYTQFESYSGLVILSNEVAGTNEGSRASLRTAESYGADQYAEWTTPNDMTSAFTWGIVRGSGSGGSRSNYQGTVGTNGTAYYITRVLSGTSVDLASNTSSGPAVSPGDRFRVEVVGTTIRLLRNDVEVLSATDANLSSGAPGIGQYGANTRADDFEFGDIGGGSSFQAAWARNANMVIQ